MTLEKNTVEDIIIAVNELSNSLCNAAYSGTAKFILGGDPEKQGQKAIEFVNEYADLTGAALRMIAVTTNLIVAGIINDEVTVEQK